MFMWLIFSIFGIFLLLQHHYTNIVRGLTFNNCQGEEMKTLSIMVAAIAIAIVAQPAVADTSKFKDPSNNVVISDGAGVSISAQDIVIAASHPPPTQGLWMNTANAGSNVLSMDANGDPDNIIIALDIGVGNSVEGVSWDVGIATEGGSWLSEARVSFLATGEVTGLFLTVGIGDDFAGDSEYSSGGVLILADAAIPDIVPGADGLINVEFYEGWDDAADTIDATWRDAASPVVVPGLGLVCTDQPACDAAVAAASGNNTNTLGPPTAVPIFAPIGLGLLALGALGLGAIGVRRQRRPV